MYNHNLIVHLTSVHPSFDIRIFHKECKTLARAGYEVVLVVQHEKDEEVGGIRIRALVTPKNRFERMTRTLWEVYQTAIKENARLYHIHDPELILIGILLKIHGKRVIYDVHEDYPSSVLSRDWIHHRFRSYIVKGVTFAEWIGIHLFDGVVAATPTIAKRFPSSKTLIVQNFPILNKLVLKATTTIYYPQRSPILVYIGVISEMRGIRGMVQAVGHLPENLGVKLWLAGSFSPVHLEDEVKEFPGWERVQFLGWQSHEGVAAMLGQARLGLVLFHPAPNHMMAQPNKLFEYMSAGIPVVASDFPLWCEIIEGAGCGLVVDPLDSKAITKAILWLLEHPVEAEAMGKRGQEAVRKRYNWDHEAEKLLVFYQKIIG